MSSPDGRSPGSPKQTKSEVGWGAAQTWTSVDRVAPLAAARRSLVTDPMSFGVQSSFPGRPATLQHVLPYTR